MRLGRLSIRKLLLVSAVFLGLTLLSIGVITNFYLRQSFSHFEMLSEIERVYGLGLRSRSVEKDFMLEETVNEIFFLTGRSNCIDEFEILSADIKLALAGLRKTTIVESLNLTALLDSTIRAHKLYVDTFTQTTALIRDKGFKDNGIIGEFRQLIHRVENQFNRINSHYYTSQVLTLRRHEKDYLLRKDLGYQKKFHEVKQNLIIDLNKTKGVDNVAELVGLLVEYGVLFDKLIELDKRIGITSDEGMISQINYLGNTVDNGLRELHERIYTYSKSKINEAVVFLFLFVGIISMVAVIVLLLVSRHIVGSIVRLQSFITRLGKGELPSKIVTQGADEISQMENSINVLTDNLRSTREFAIEVGNGNLESEVNVFGNRGDLGGALIEMRKKLLQVAQERERQTLETNQRIWATEGMALFADILRAREKSLDDFAFEVVKNLVKYTHSNQASLFVIDKDENDKSFLNVQATYAYDRRKFVKSRVELNEGLVGVCALEAETTLLTDIPKDYIKITSGLGYATPTCLILVPLKVDQEVVGVIEMASFNVYKPFEVDFIEKVAANVASTLQMVAINNKTRHLLEYSQQQAEELQAQEEEMRQNMEEMRTTQEWMNAREEELKNALTAKEVEVDSLTLRIKGDRSEFTQAITTLEAQQEIFNSNFMIAKLSPEGNILTCNDKFRKTILNVDEMECPSIFDNSIPGQEEANRTEWSRVVNGETYKGIIHRLDPFGNQIAIYAVFAPLLNSKGSSETIQFVGHRVGFADSTQAASGVWLRENLEQKKLTTIDKVHMS